MGYVPSKCNIMHVSRKKLPLEHTYYLKGEPLGVVDNASYLGTNISKDLSWHSQVTKVTSMANRTLVFVKNNIKTPKRSVKEKAYQAIVRPSLDYASSVKEPHQKGFIQEVENVQRRAARYVTSNYEQKARVTEMINELRWENLD